jgi:hypothetical protein
MKIAVVICTHVAEFEGVNKRRGLDPVDRVYCDVLKVLACHKVFKNSCLDYDLWIVDNDSPYPIWLRELEKYQHLKRENTGFSFGAYKYFWETKGQDYDYFLFHEQDIAPCKPGWLNEIYDQFVSSSDVGAVGSNLLWDKDIFLEDEHQRVEFLCGSFIFTSYAILKECGLPIEYLPGYDAGTYNEMHFEQGIKEKGYKIVGVNDRDRVGSYGRHRIWGDTDKPGWEETITPMISINSKEDKAIPIYKHLEKYDIH